MSDLAVLEKLNAGYIRSVVESDVKWFEENLSADFLNTNPDASLVDRAGFLKQVAQPFALKDFRIDDVKIRVLGDTAIIHARTLYAKPDGAHAAGRYTDIWQRQGGRWLCVAAQVARG